MVWQGAARWVLAGHDYLDGVLPEGIFGVKRAVDEFAAETGLAVVEEIVTGQVSRLPPQIAVSDDVDWRHIAARHELTGAGILNVTHFCAVDVLARQSRHLDLKALEAAIQREYIKEGKIP